MNANPVETINNMLDISGSNHKRDFSNPVVKRGFTDDEVNKDHYELVVSYIHSTEQYKEILELYTTLLERI